MSDGPNRLGWHATAMSVSAQQRGRVIRLYKDLHRLGRDYPDPTYDFNGRMRQLFEKNRNLTDPDEVEKAIQLGEFIRNETLALYSLRKYRHMRRAYPPAEGA